jgi:hypothetical protein
MSSPLVLFGGSLNELPGFAAKGDDVTDLVGVTHQSMLPVQVLVDRSELLIGQGYRHAFSVPGSEDF